ncbi:MAG TPA: biotin/lipoyl-containing protein [bacterium]|jgi:biotin carboxyl carrier protein
MDYRYNINSEEKDVRIDASGSSLTATLGEKIFDVEIVPTGESSAILKLNGKSIPVRYIRRNGEIHLMVEGWNFVAKEPMADTGISGGHEADVVDGLQTIVAPMPGQVVKVNVKEGEKVTKKQCLVIVEAMKMENEMNSAVDGTVTAVHVEAGQQVDAMQPLLEVTQSDK